MQAAISKTNIKSFHQTFKSNTSLHISRNALIRNTILDVAMDWDAFRKVDHTYSHTIPNEIKKVTNQKASGRCWGFAGLNLMRLAVCDKYNLKEFEFSQNYFMFCDKLEKSNYFLENILATLDESFDSRLMMWLVSEPIGYGGQFIAVIPERNLVIGTHSNISSTVSYQEQLLDYIVNDIGHLFEIEN